ncbi:MAG: preprotein translocase subunit SecG [Candidatus Omnitrophica bacterium]|nr:preprotein translocase subunit SecG [Candidatus Omnitrophota bacterium]
MYALLIVIHVIACLILITVILLQSGRGGGLSGLFGAGSSQTIFGARASTFLTRLTTAAAIAFLLTCISLTILSSRKGKSLLRGKSVVTEQMPEEETETSETEAQIPQEQE